MVHGVNHNEKTEKKRRVLVKQKRALVISHMANCRECKKRAIKCMKSEDISHWELSKTKAPRLRENEILETKRGLLDRIEELEEINSKMHDKYLWLQQNYKELENVKRK